MGLVGAGLSQDRPLRNPDRGVSARRAKRNHRGAQRTLATREASRRFGTDVENHLIIALGDHDLDIDISTARSRLQLANVLDEAQQNSLPVLVVGPIPGIDAERNTRLADLNRAYADVTTRRGFHYVDTFTALQHHEQWRSDLDANHGLPGQAGYGLIAWLVLHRGWYQWLNLPEPTA